MFETIDLQIKESQKEIEFIIEKGIDAEKIKLQYLRSFVLLIVSEYENLLEKIFIHRASLCNDEHVINYVKFQIEKKFRSPDLSKINQTLGFFDNTVKTSFLNTINNTPIHAAWDNIMKARHFIVHKQGSLNITFEELLQSYEETKKVLYEILNLFNINENDLKLV